jgi:hypothetical protein
VVVPTASHVPELTHETAAASGTTPAKVMGCSVQPVPFQRSAMTELRDEVHSEPTASQFVAEGQETP